MNFCEKLKNLREKTNLNKTEMAKEMNISRSVYIEVENGTRMPSKAFLKKTSEYFSVSLDWLMETGETSSNDFKNNSSSSLIDKFLDNLIEEGIITDPNNIDDDTANMIINAVKAQVALKLKKNSKNTL